MKAPLLSLLERPCQVCRFNTHRTSKRAPHSWSNCRRMELIPTEATELPHTERQQEPSVVRGHHLRVQEALSWLVYTPQPWPSYPDFPPSTPAPLAAPGWPGSAPDPALLPLAPCWAAAVTWRGLQHVLSWPTSPMEAVHLGWVPYGLLWVSWHAHTCPSAPPFLTESLPVLPSCQALPPVRHGLCLSKAMSRPQFALDSIITGAPTSPDLKPSPLSCLVWM